MTYLSVNGRFMSKNQEIICLKKGRSNVYESPLTNKYVEDHIAVLHWYQSKGWDGCCGYGSAFFMLLNAICFTKLEPKDWYDRFDRFTHDIERKKISETEIKKNIRECTRETVDLNIKTILKRTYFKPSNGYDPAWCPSRKLLLSLFDQLDRIKICDFVLYLIRNKDRLSSEYWPHLIIYKDNVFRFVEVSRSKRKTKRLAKVNNFCDEVFKPYGFDVIYAAIDGKCGKAPIIEEARLVLEQKGGHEWLSPLTGEKVGPEQAVLDWYKRDGWNGTAGEGDIILFLLKCMSFKELPRTAYNYNRFYKDGEGKTRITYHSVAHFNIYNQLGLPPTKRHRAFRDWGTLNERLSDIKTITIDEIGNNYDTITSCPLYFNDSEIDYYSRFTKEMINSLSECIGRDQLVSLAKLLAISKGGYNFTYGWPDLTLFKETKVIFREVKANSDKLRENQEQLIFEILYPLGFDVKIVKLSSREISDGS